MSAAILGTLLATIGCQPTINGHSSGNVTAGEPAEFNGQQLRWPYWPMQMRIHPLTRMAVNRETGGRLIEARVEFKDQDNATTRCVGEMKFILYAKSGGHTGEYINEWVIDLSDLERNAEHFDEVTRTYLFRLEIDGEEEPDRYDLRAFFTSANDDMMQSQYVIPTS